MIRYLIKNNMKLMARNKWILLLVVLGPILVSMILGDVFKNVLSKYEPSDDITVGYYFEEDSVFAMAQNQIFDAGREAGISFVEHKSDDIENTMHTKDLDGFVVFEKDSYTVYSFKDKPGDGMTLQFFMSKVAGQGASTMMDFMDQDDSEVKLTTKELEFLPQIDAKDYYGIAFTSYYTWCGFICYCAVGNISKNSVSKKYRVTGISSLKYYLANVISTAIFIIVGIAVSIILQAVLLDVDFGSNPLEIVLFILTVFAACAFGFALHSIFENMALTIIAEWIVIWWAGFIGGCFETYMLQPISETIKKISPIYHTNRALIEMSVMGKSNYTSSAIIFLVAIIVVCSVIAISVESLKRRGDK